VRYGKLSFVDLAGSERVKDSKSEGTMLKETININKSLSVLGKVRTKNIQYATLLSQRRTLVLQCARCLMLRCVPYYGGTRSSYSPYKQRWPMHDHIVCLPGSVSMCDTCSGCEQS
jgi:hypothetical protein